MYDRFKRSSHTAIALLILLFGAPSALAAGGAAGPRALAAKHARRGEGRHKPGAVAHRPGHSIPVRVSGLLLGDTSVEWQSDELPAGQAEAFRLRARASGLAGAVHVFISAGDRARRLIVGLYSSASGRPGTLLGSAAASASKAGTWTTVSIPPVELVSGRDYWLAILGEGGTLRYRDRRGGACPSETSAARGLRALARTWLRGTKYSDCPASAYVTGPAPTTPSLVTPTLAGALPATAASAAAPATIVKVPVAGEAPPSSISAPEVSGTAAEGQILAASEGSWTGNPSAYAYQWEDCDTAGEACSEIPGATAAAYRIGASDVGDMIRVLVTATNAGGSTSAPSAPTGTVISGPQIFVAQAGTGTESGESCERAHSLAWLNASSSWGSGPGRIAAGTTVNLCGSLVEGITAAGSGASGSPVTLRFEPSAKITMPVCPGAAHGCIDTAGHDYLDIEGTSESEHGVIENTEQETGRKHQTSYGIEALKCVGCAIRFMTIANLYVHASTSDSVVESSGIRGINFSGSYITISHDTIHDVGWALFAAWNAEDKDVQLEYNTLYHINHGFASTAAFSGGDIGPIVFEHNHLYGFSRWDTGAADSYHHDGVHCFTAGGDVAHYNGLYIGANRFGPETGENMNSFVFIEGDAEGTPCGDSSSNVWIYDNVASSTEGISNGDMAVDSTNAHIYNNTLIGPNTETVAPCLLIGGQADEVSLENNLITTCNELIDAQVAGDLASGGLDYNLYANGGDNAFVCTGHFYLFEHFSSWQSCTGGDSHSKTAPDAEVVSSGEEAGALESGSPAELAGTNLTSLCSGTPGQALCRNVAGETRPATGPWSVGAY